MSIATAATRPATIANIAHHNRNTAPRVWLFRAMVLEPKTQGDHDGEDGLAIVVPNALMSSKRHPAQIATKGEDKELHKEPRGEHRSDRGGEIDRS